MSIHQRNPLVQDDLERITQGIASLRRADASIREKERQRRHALIRSIAEADAIHDHERETRGESL
jgi:hypothetical protein